MAGTPTYRIVVDGAVSCNYHPLSGVGVDSIGGGSGFAQWDFGSLGGFDGGFSLTICTKLPTNPSLYVGYGTGRTATIWVVRQLHIRKVRQQLPRTRSDLQRSNSAKAPAAGIRCSLGSTHSEKAAINWVNPYVNPKRSTSKPPHPRVKET